MLENVFILFEIFMVTIVTSIKLLIFGIHTAASSFFCVSKIMSKQSNEIYEGFVESFKLETFDEVLFGRNVATHEYFLDIKLNQLKDILSDQMVDFVGEKV